MGNNKITKKTRLFYRSLSTKPCKTIADPTLRESIAEQLRSLKQANGKKIVVGLSASLRCLKKNAPSAVLLDSTIPKHIALYLTEYANKIAIPIVQVQNLDEVNMSSDGHHCTELVERKPNQIARIPKLKYDSSALEVESAKPGIPNHKKLKTGNQAIDPIRYLELHKYDIRKTCDRIMVDRNDRLMKTPLFAFSANVMCKIEKNISDNFVPIEIAIYGYSLEKGALSDAYHVMIDSGLPPTGCANSSREHADKSHKISFPPRGKYPDVARNDYKKIYKEMLDFTRPGERTILVSSFRDVKQAEGCLHWLYNKSVAGLTAETGGQIMKAKVSTWTILPVIEYITSMSNYIQMELLNRPPKLALNYRATLLLDNSDLDYNQSLMCSYHQQEDNQTKWCAKNCALRMFSNLEPILEEIYKSMESVVV